jgi:hypothetical protein
MSVENTVIRSLSELGKGKTDWKRLSEMSEAETEHNALSDSDALPTHYNDWDDAKVTMPQKHFHNPIITPPPEQDPTQPGLFD